MGVAKTLFGRPKEYSRITAKPTSDQAVIGGSGDVIGRCISPMFVADR